jgi:hypothetical protein
LFLCICAYGVSVGIALCWTVHHCLQLLQRKELCYFEMSETTNIVTLCHILEDLNPQDTHCGNLQTFVFCITLHFTPACASKHLCFLVFFWTKRQKREMVVLLQLSCCNNILVFCLFQFCNRVKYHVSFFS